MMYIKLLSNTSAVKLPTDPNIALQCQGDVNPVPFDCSNTIATVSYPKFACVTGYKGQNSAGEREKRALVPKFGFRIPRMTGFR